MNIGTINDASLLKLGPGACWSALYDQTHDLSITVTHTGKDGWRGSWIKIIFDSGNAVVCDMKNHWLKEADGNITFTTACAQTTGKS